jgi:hypothetical protein
MDKVFVRRQSDQRFAVYGLDGVQYVWLGAASDADLANEMARKEGERLGVPVETWDERAWRLLVATWDWWLDAIDESKTGRPPLCEHYLEGEGSCSNCPLHGPLLCAAFPLPEPLLEADPKELPAPDRALRAGLCRAMKDAIGEKRREMQP